jgi:hypothetical protein
MALAAAIGATVRPARDEAAPLPAQAARKQA